MSISAYQIEKQDILRRAYQLICCIFANQQISEIANPNELSDPLKQLESRFLYSQVSTLFLEVAILYRSLDDQYESAPDSNEKRRYIERRELTNKKYCCMMFEDRISLRECCNKIIHAKVFEPHEQYGETPHRRDVAAYYGGEQKEILWHHLNGNIRIAGTHQGREWFFLIQVPEFVEALAFLLNEI